MGCCFVLAPVYGKQHGIEQSGTQDIVLYSDCLHEAIALCTGALQL